jgi:ATP phosphoribosyltransferase regulatory subunit
MKKYNLITPEGTRDLLFEECRVRREIETKLMDLFKGAGYSEVITPFVEFYDVFDSDMGGLGQEFMYKLTDSKGRLMVIRPDSTIPIIRLAETRLKAEPRPLGLCYNQTIYNVNPKEAGKDDEIAQCGVEAIGEEDDERVLMLAAQVFKAIGLDYRFEIGNCSFFDVLAGEHSLGADESERIRHLVETKNYPELKALGVPGVFIELPKLFGGGEVFDKAEALFRDKDLRKHLESLRNIYDKLCVSVKDDKITVDLGLTNTRGYYTGILFNGYIGGFGEPVLTGGRYKVSNTCATGFAVNVSAVARLRGKNHAK